jgi:hypothetical protein
MKNKIYYIGLSACIITTFGCISKVMHWPGAGILLSVGLSFFALLFLPLALKSSFKEEKNRKLKTLYILTAVILGVNFISTLFKIMHWPWSNLMILISLPLPFVVLLPVYLLSNLNDKDINFKNFTAVLFFFAYLAAILALMSTGPSRNVIDGYVKSAYSFDEKTSVIYSGTLSLKDKLEKDTLPHINMVSNYNKISEEADRLCNKIDELKKVLILNNSENASQVFVYNGKPDLWKTKPKESRPNIDMHYLTELKNEINIFKILLQKECTTGSILYNYISDVFDTYENKFEVENWENDFLKDKILISAIERLNYIKYRVRLAEFESISEMD